MLAKKGQLNYSYSMLKSDPESPEQMCVTEEKNFGLFSSLISSYTNEFFYFVF